MKVVCGKLAYAALTP
ncbi:hypothetical protein QX207_21765 [Vibrio vulnificus]|nr:hypothetical protein [Vibrio vulnificus]MDS1842260.1 hypothetical protein [Vibrio vulnificus]MDS1850849.1 hypothetical protein [Vibrio vulnificus]